MSDERGSGVGSGESEQAVETPTPDPRLPITGNGKPTTDNVRWPLLYGAVLIELTLLIIIFYAFTKAFS